MHHEAPRSPSVDLRLGLWMAFATAGLALVSLWLSRLPGSVAGLWLPNIFGVMLLCRQPYRAWPALLACHLGGATLAGLLYGDALPLLARFQVNNGVEVLIGAALMRALGAAPSLQPRPTTSVWVTQAMLAVVLPGAMGAALSALLIAPALNLAPADMALRWFTSGNLGGFTLLGLAIALGNTWMLGARGNQAMPWRGEPRGWRDWAGVPLAVLLALLIVQWNPFRFVFFGALALCVALLLPLRPALVTLTLLSLVLGWGVAEGAAHLYLEVEPDLFTAYAIHLLSILPAIWVSLERAEARWERDIAAAAFDASADGLLMLNAKGEVLQANGVAADWLKRPLADLVGQPIDALLPELEPQLESPAALAPNAWTRIARTSLQEGQREAEARLRRFAIGRYEWSWMVSLRDVTQRRQEERTLQEALHRLERFARVTPGVLAIFRLAPDGHVCMPWQSAQAQALWDLPSETLAQDAAPLFERMAPATRLTMLASIQESARTLSLFRSEFEYRAGAGQPKWIAIESMPAREPDGAVVWFGLCRDVTEERREMLAQREAELRWAMAADAGGVGIWTLDWRSSSVAANARFFAMLGLQPEGDALPVAAFAALIDSQTPLSWLQTDCEEARADADALPVQVLRMRRGAADWIWVELRVQAVDRAASGGVPLRLTGTLLDVSDRVEADRIRSAQASAEAANQAKSRFVSRMSHELRTPLNAVLGFAELLEEDPANAMTATQRQHVKQVIRAGESLLTLINDVLDLSQIEAREMVIALAPTPLGPLLDEVATAMLPMARRHRVRLELSAADAAWVLMTDRRRLVQVLLNLISNGIKYNCPEGWVRLSATEAAGTPFCWVHVEDSGRGLSEAQLQRLGEPFNRLGAESSGIEGTGIGLSISKSLLTSMGCELQVRSVLGQGSSFSVGIPLATQTSPRG